MSTRHCAFVQTRACPIDVEEIPLDVCKLCIEAWKTSAEIQNLTGANVLGPTLMVPATPQAIPVMPTIPGSLPSTMTPTSVGPASRAPVSEPFTFIPNGIGDQHSSDENEALLYNLDRAFMDDRISAEEYVEQRRGIVNQLASQKDSIKPTLLAKATSDGYLDPEDSMPAGPPDDYFKVVNLDEDMILSHSHPRVLPLMLIERKNGKVGVTKYPEDWSLPKSINRSNLESVYELYDELRENQEKIMVQFNGTKLGLLGKKNDKILCFILENDDKMENYHGEINHLTDLLETTNDFDDLLKILIEAKDKTKDLSFN